MPGKFSVTQNFFGQLLALLHQMFFGDSIAGKLIQGKSLCIGFLLDTVVGNLLSGCTVNAWNLVIPGICLMKCQREINVLECNNSGLDLILLTF
jgi:hypothetical protein